MRPTRHPILTYEDYVHPDSVAGMQAIVANARAAGAQIRVRGSLHGEPGSVLGDGFSVDGRRRPIVQVMLDKLVGVTIDQANARAIVLAGTSMGGDPHAPGSRNPQANHRNSLFEELDRAGFALPVTGGISHQTISGFLSTGSAGGSVVHSFHDVIRRIRFVDGMAQIVVLSRGDANFDAALVSLGLFGVLVDIEIDLVPRFGVKGRRSVQPAADCDYDLFGDSAATGRPTLEDFLTQKTYSRVMWWPQPGVERVELWEARTAPYPLPDARIHQSLGVIGPMYQWLARFLYAAGFESVAPRAGDGVTSPPRSPQRILDMITAPSRFLDRALRNAYREVSPDSPTRLGRSELIALAAEILRAARTGELAAQKVWDPASGAPSQSQASVYREALLAIIRQFRTLPLAEAFIASSIDAFVPKTPLARTIWTDEIGHPHRTCVEYFYDTWREGLPMDNPMHDRLLPVRFTELWLPLSKARPAMRALRDHFRRFGLAGTGTFTIEVYAAKASPAWLSAAYGEDVVRFDPFRFDDGDEIGRKRFFNQFFGVLRQFSPRFHLGKALSDPWSETGVDYRRTVMPKLADFLTLRQTYDPNDVFLTRYWAEHFGIVPATPD